MAKKTILRKAKEGLASLVLAAGLAGCGSGLDVSEGDMPDVNPTLHAGTWTVYESDVQGGENNSIDATVFKRLCISNPENVNVELVDGKYDQNFPFNVNKTLTKVDDDHYDLTVSLEDNANAFVNGESYTFKITGLLEGAYTGIIFYNAGHSPEWLTEHQNPTEPVQTQIKYGFTNVNGEESNPIVTPAFNFRVYVPKGLESKLNPNLAITEVGDNPKIGINNPKTSYALTKIEEKDGYSVYGLAENLAIIRAADAKSDWDLFDAKFDYDSATQELGAEVYFPN